MTKATRNRIFDITLAISALCLAGILFAILGEIWSDSPDNIFGKIASTCFVVGLPAGVTAAIIKMP